MEAEKIPGEIYFTTLKALFWVFCAGVFAFAIRQIWPVILTILSILAPFITGLILAYVFHPIVEFFQHRLKVGRGMGVFLVAFMLAGILTYFAAILGPILYTQIKSMFGEVSSFFTKGNFIDRVFSHLTDEERKMLKEMIQEWMVNLQNNFATMLESEKESLTPVATTSIQAASQTIYAAVSAFGWFGGWVGTSMVTSLTTWWYLMDMHKIPGIIRRVLPGRHPERTWDILLKANHSVGGFLRGQLIACIGVGLMTMVVMFLVGPKDYAILIGILAGSVHFIPYLGPAVGLTPGLLWAIFTPELKTWDDRSFHLIMISGGFGLIQAIDGFVFQPFIVGAHAALHPIAVMLALVVGAQFGLTGMILAVPFAAALKVVFVEVYWNNTRDFMENESPPVETKSPEGEMT